MISVLPVVYGLFVFIRDEFLPPEIADRWRIGGLMNIVAWYWWVIFGLSLLLGITALRKSKPQKMQEFGEIDILIKPEVTEEGQVVGLAINSNNYIKPIFCKAIINRMDWYKEDPVKGNIWVSINTKKFNALSWHYGGTDDEGFKKVHVQPEYLNIVKLPFYMDQEFSGGVILGGGTLWRFTFSFIHKEQEFLAGKYRMQIDIVCKIDDKYKIKSWLGCVDMPNAREHSKDWSNLSIWECEDVKEWKQELSKRTKE